MLKLKVASSINIYSISKTIKRWFLDGEDAVVIYLMFEVHEFGISLFNYSDTNGKMIVDEVDIQ